MTNNIFDFNELLDSINECYSDNVKKSLPKITDFYPKIYIGSNINEIELESFITNEKNCYHKSVARRILAIKKLQEIRDKKLDLNIDGIWNLIYLSIIELPAHATISSIGSQGFLSIPLFRFRTNMKSFEFIRLHIWDNSLSQYIDKQTRENFSVHSHSFHAQSWILAGAISNERYSIAHSSQKQIHSLFKIEYNKTLNKVNKHTSNAVNTNKDIILTKISEEKYFHSSTYEISAGHYHKGGSLSKDGFSATLFSFTAKNGSVDKSFVIGPSNIKNSEINRKEQIDPSYLLNKLNNKIKHG